MGLLAIFWSLQKKAGKRGKGGRLVDGYLIDTGSRVTMIPREHSNTAKITTEGNFVAANGTPIKTYGTKPITITILSKQYKHTAIVGDVKQPILGLEFLRRGE